MADDFDCCVLGAGIAGTASALVLARLGLRVLVVEAGKHPRFAIGESLVPTTTLGLDYLARTYAVPELRQISHYPAMMESGLAGWPKLGFWFGHHQEGTPLKSGQEMMFISPGLPVGPDVHMLRQDVDAFLASRLKDYGVEYYDRASIADWDAGAEHVTLEINRDGAARSVAARFLLDCSGHASFLAKRLDLRESPTRLRTNTRSIYSHFRDVRLLEDLLGTPCERFGTLRDACTVHHCFAGGWFWLIRFNNGICSIGLVLDRGTYPDNDLAADDEFWSFVNRFPTLRAQLAGAAPIRPLVKTGRLQFTSRRICGDRYFLAPHAASFVDPLFSTGIDLTAAFIARMAPIVAGAMNDNDFRAERFGLLDELHRLEIDGIDRIVHGMVCSFRDPDVFKQYWRIWISASLLQYFVQLSSDPANPLELLAHYGASLPTWNQQLESLYRAVTESGSQALDDVARRMKAIMDKFPEPCNPQASNWEIGSNDPCCPWFRPVESVAWFQAFAAADPVLAARTRPELLDQARERFRLADIELTRRYQASVAGGTPYHRGVDFIRDQQF